MPKCKLAFENWNYRWWGKCPNEPGGKLPLPSAVRRDIFVVTRLSQKSEPQRGDI